MEGGIGYKWGYLGSQGTGLLSGKGLVRVKQQCLDWGLRIKTVDKQRAYGIKLRQNRRLKQQAI